MKVNIAQLCRSADMDGMDISPYKKCEGSEFVHQFSKASKYSFNVERFQNYFGRFSSNHAGGQFLLCASLEPVTDDVSGKLVDAWGPTRYVTGSNLLFF